MKYETSKHAYNFSNLFLLEYFFAPLVNAKRFFEEPFQLYPLIIEQCSGAASSFAAFKHYKWTNNWLQKKPTTLGITESLVVVYLETKGPTGDNQFRDKGDLSPLLSNQLIGYRGENNAGNEGYGLVAFQSAPDTINRGPEVMTDY